MLSKKVLLIVVMLFKASCGEDLLYCPTGAHRVISYDLQLLDPSNISAFSENGPGFIDDYLVHRSNVPARLWCSEAGVLGASERPFLINITFTRTVALTHLISAGFSNAFVNRFTMGYSLDGNNYTLYHHLNTQEAELQVPEIDTVLTLHPPPLATRLQLTIVSAVIGSTDRVCWHLAMLGCPLEEATTIVTTPTNTMQVPQATQATPTLQATPILLERKFIVTDFQLVVVIVPVALATVVLVACVVAIGVCACVVQQKKRTIREKATRISRKCSSKLHKPTPTQDVRGSPLVEGEDVTQMIQSPRLSSSLAVPAELTSIALSSDCSLHTEGTQMTERTEPCPQLLGNREHSASSDGDSMVDNPIYSIPFQRHTGFPIPCQRETTIEMMSNECYHVSDSQQVLEELNDFHSHEPHSSMT